MKQKKLWRGVLIGIFAVFLVSCKESDEPLQPEITATSELSFRAGTESDVSPFKGETGFLCLQWLMNSQFAGTQDYASMAVVLITSEKQVVEAESVDDLTQITMQNEETQVLRDEKSDFYAGQQILKVASQVITVKWGYEIYDPQSFRTIPYLKLEKPEVKSCEVEKNEECYKVNVHFKQILSSGGVRKNFSREEEYVLTYTGVVKS